MISTLALVALVALFAAGLTLVLRAAPFIRGAVFRGTKPWACDLCMSWWGSCAGGIVALGAGLWGTFGAATIVTWLLGTFATVPVSMLVLRFVGQPAGTFDLPPADTGAALDQPAANDNDGDVLR
mgnify:FL=1